MGDARVCVFLLCDCFVCLCFRKMNGRGVRTGRVG